MKGRPQDAMDVGIVHFMAFPEVLKYESQVVPTLEKLCADDDFQVVEVAPIKDSAVRAQAIDVVRKSGNKVSVAAQPILLGEQLDLSSCDPDVRLKAVRRVREITHEAAEWQACDLAVLSGPDPGEDKRADAAAWLVTSVKEICEFGRRNRGTPIALESFDRVSYGKNCLIGPTDEAVRLVKRVYGYYLTFGLLLDLSHLPLLAESPGQAVNAAAPYLRHVHLGNAVTRHANHPAYGDNHPPFGIPEGDNGVDEVAAFLKALLDIGYVAEGKHNIVSFEVKPYGDMTSESVIANCKETLDAAWAAL